MNTESDIDVSAVIDRLGGTSATAQMCDIKPPSVSEWKANGRIPKPWLKFLMLARPDVFEAQSPPTHEAGSYDDIYRPAVQAPREVA